MAQLFDTFEVNRVPRWPLMSRLVALSVVLHGLFFVAIVYVPALRGLLHVASTMSGIEFSREDYDKTLLGQRATVIKFAPHEKLYYPPDYFGAPEIAETTQLDPTMVQPAAPPPPPPMPVYRPRRQRPSAAPTPEPTPTPEEVADATPTPTPLSEEERKKAEAEMAETEKKTGVSRLRIKVKPWEDLAAEGKQLFEQGKLNLNTEVDVTATAERMADGKLDPATVNLKWKNPPDETTDMIARRVITAVSESEMLVTLEGAKAVDMALKLNEKDIAIVIGNKFATPAEAEKYANGYGLLLFWANAARKGTDDAEIYKNVKVRQEGDRFVISFQMPKDAAGKLITNMLSKKAKDAAASQNKAEAGAAATP
jgi:hypothetical protein